MYVQQQVRILAASSEIHTCDPDVLTWACLMLRATTEKGDELRQRANARLCLIEVSESKQNELEDAFLLLPQPEGAAHPRLASAQVSHRDIPPDLDSLARHPL